MPIIVRMLLVVGTTVVVLLLVRVVLARLIDPAQVRAAEPSADVVMEAMAGLYGVLVAFLLAGAWERYDNVRAILLQELSQIAEIQQIARVLPSPTGEALQREISAYVATARSELQARAEQQRATTISNGAGMFNVLASFEPRTPAQEHLQATALDLVGDLSKQHRLLIFTGHRPVPGLVWVVLIGGAVVLLGMVAVSSRTSRVAAGYLACIAVVISLALFTIYALSYPLRTDFVNATAPLARELSEFPVPPR